MNDIENILINLRVLSRLQCHTRLNTTETLFRIHTPANWIPTWAKRWWSAQNRVTDISRIRNVYTNSIKYVNSNHSESDRIKKYLKDSLNGLNNLKTTYVNDVTTVALIDVVVDNVTQLLGPNENIQLEFIQSNGDNMNV